jgi:hypothetical protein
VYFSIAQWKTVTVKQNFRSFLKGLFISTKNTISLTFIIFYTFKNPIRPHIPPPTLPEHYEILFLLKVQFILSLGLMRYVREKTCPSSVGFGLVKNKEKYLKTGRARADRIASREMCMCACRGEKRDGRLPPRGV